MRATRCVFNWSVLKMIAPDLLEIQKLRYAIKKKNDIIWEFFPNVGPPPPPPPPPLLGTPYPKKNFSVYFAF